MKTTLLRVACALQLLSSAAVADDTKIGWIGPLTGNSAVLGIDSSRSVRLAAKDATTDEHKFSVKLEDDGYETRKALTAYHKLVNDGVRVIFMQTYGAVFALADRALRDGVLIIDTLDSTDDLAALPESVLAIGTQTESISKAVADDMIKNGRQNVAILIEDNDPWMPYVSKRAVEYLKAGGVGEVAEHKVLAQETDYSSLLTKFRQAKVDAIFFLGNDQMGRALKQARQLGITAQFYGIGSMMSPAFQDLAGEAIEGSRLSHWEAAESEKYKGFISRYQAEFQSPPIIPLAAAPTYDGVILVTSCVRSGKSTVPQIRECLLSTKNYTGVSGEITFDQDGVVRSIKEKLYSIRGRKLAAVE